MKTKGDTTLSLTAATSQERILGMPSKDAWDQETFGLGLPFFLFFEANFNLQCRHL